MYRSFKLLCAALCIALLFACSTTASAAPIETDRESNLTLTFAPGKEPAADVQYRLYRIASVSQDVQFTYTPEFEGYPIEPVGTTAAQWRNLAETLQGIISADRVVPDYTAQTDENGQFTLSGLPTGLYLITGDIFTRDGIVYTPQPFLLPLPYQDGDSWIYDVHSDGKYEERPEDKEITVHVLKVWHDKNAPDRPVSATVALYGDGTLYDTIVLDQTNAWQHQWTGLSSLIAWTVVEVDVPEGYIVSVGRNNELYGVTNSIPGDDEGSTTPTEPTEPEGPTEPDEPTRPDETTRPEEPTRPLPPPPEKPEIPNTGLLWWPVPVLCLAGIVCLAIGILRRRGNNDEE